MLRRLAYVIAATLVLLGGLTPTTLLADTDCPWCPKLGVRCMDFDPNFPTAEGYLMFDPDANSLLLRVDFLNGPIPDPAQMAEVTDGHLLLTCDNPLTGMLNYASNFQGATAPLGWDFTTEFTHVFFDGVGGGIQSCSNPRVDVLDFQYQGLFYNCFAGFLTPLPQP